MKFQFYLGSSRVVDFVFFPALALYEKSEKAFGALNYEIMDPASTERWTLIAEEMSGLKDEFERFKFSGYSYYFDLMYQFDLRQLKDENDFLASVKALSKDALTAHLSSFLDRKLDLVIPTAEKSPNYLMEAFQILSSSSLETSDKWKLLEILEDPEHVRDEFVAFMERVKPIFHKFYQGVEYSISGYAKQLERTLASGDHALLEAMMEQYVFTETIEALRKSETINFYLLGLSDYSFNLITHADYTDIFLGINVLDYYFRLTEFRQRSKEERITVFKNLADKTRYEVLKLIAQGDSSTKVLAEKLGVTSAAISYHLKQLTNDRLIQFDANRRKNGYRINETRMKDAIAGLLEDLNIK
ncbi:MAG: metalloregulator ArsR/SmtB family transcription factor [Clostridiaceae bacterium]